MRSPKNYRKWVNKLRKKYGKKNGVIPDWAFDCPPICYWPATSKRGKRVRARNNTVRLVNNE